MTNEHKIDLAEYSAMGLDTSAVLTEEQKNERQKILHGFEEFLEVTSVKFDSIEEKFLYGDLTRQEAEVVWSQYPSVDEAMAHTPGRLTENDFYEAKREIVIFPIIEKLRTLVEYGKEKKIFQHDFIAIKRRLLKLLFQQFGSSGDIPIFENTIQRLKKNDMIPNSYSFEDMTKYCPLGRWY